MGPFLGGKPRRGPQGSKGSWVHPSSSRCERSTQARQTGPRTPFRRARGGAKTSAVGASSTALRAGVWSCERAPHRRYALSVHRFTALRALEILDSRGRPTLQVSATLASGVTATAGVPSGASTGSNEAVERRDGDADRYGGAGVQRAVMSVEGEIADTIVDSAWASIVELDEALVRLDGTPNKERLGTNAIVGVSMAATRAMAAADGRALYEWLRPLGVELRLPVPHFNVINGGRTPTMSWPSRSSCWPRWAPRVSGRRCVPAARCTPA